jgi:YggT family protein
MPQVVFTFFNLLISALIYAIIGRALISWFDPGFSNPVSRFLRDVTEPILGPIRRIMPGGMMIDFSPMVAIFLLYFLRAMIPAAP